MTDPRKIYFDAAREVDADGILVGDDILKLDTVLDMLGVPRAVVDEPDSDRLTISDNGIALIKRFEGFARVLDDGRVASYPDPGTGGKPWTIGWGATGSGIGPDTIWTRQQADDWFDNHIERYAEGVRKAIGDAPTTQDQFDALTSFHYNTGAIGKATLTKKHNAGDFAGAEREFHRWVRAGGRVMNGLVRRRKAEAKLYRGNA